MTEFENLKSQWGKQPEPTAPQNGAKLILEKMNFLKKEQRIVNMVLFATSLILIWFYIYIKAYKNMLVSLGLVLMIGSLLVRIYIEYSSIRKLERMDVTKDAGTFKTDMIAYYKKRIQTHYIATPIILVVYAIGFMILVPFFRDSLSYGFYLYIVISSIIILLLMVFFIAKQIKKELNILQQFKN